MRHTSIATWRVKKKETCVNCVDIPQECLRRPNVAVQRERCTMHLLYFSTVYQYTLFCNAKGEVSRQFLLYYLPEESMRVISVSKQLRKDMETPNAMSFLRNNACR
jgi:hypothetical protein